MKFLLGVYLHNNEAIAKQLIERLNKAFSKLPSLDFCLIDDGSSDCTTQYIEEYLPKKAGSRYRFIHNTNFYGYGGTQKLLFRFGISARYDACTMIPGNLIEEQLQSLLHLLKTYEKYPTDILVGVSDLRAYRSPLMALISRMQSTLAGQRILGWRSPFKVFKTKTIARTAYELNTNNAYFDTELILQILDLRGSIKEIADSQYRNQSNSAFTVFRDSLRALKATLKYRLQQFNLFYDFRYSPEQVHSFDGSSFDKQELYTEKLNSNSPHSLVSKDAQLVAERSAVLDIGCATGYVANQLILHKRCRVTGIDMIPESALITSSLTYRRINLEQEQAALNEILEKQQFDVVLLLDIVEHLSMPELFLLNLNRHISHHPPKFIVSTGNVAFIAIRLMLLLGFFNYGKRGILDITHKRLFSLRTFRNIMEQTGFIVIAQHFFPLPFQALGFPKRLAQFLERINMALIRASPSLFAYQILLVANPIAFSVEP